MVLRIRREHLEKVFRHARECYPLEACGLLVGKIVGGDRMVEEVYPTKNILESAFEYRVDPEEQLKIFEEAERKGLDIIGSYHSHPFWGAFWSRIDEERSKFWAGYSFLIVSPKSGSFSSYIKEGEGVKEESVEIL
jgi:proteasome lid subunit RPN8/RPN11